MKEANFSDFTKSLRPLRKTPLYGQIELTYKCPLDCRHCYCRKEPMDELKPDFWEKIIDQAAALGGIILTFTGGDPLIYPGFVRVYSHAKKRGFLVNVFTSGRSIKKEVFDCLEKYPPLNIEITLNSLKEKNYQAITGRDCLRAVMNNIRKIKERSLPLVLKCNGLKENKDEIILIKRFTQGLLGRGKFKFDPLIFPGLNGEEEPKLHRLEPEEVIRIEKSDPDMTAQRIAECSCQAALPGWQKLYRCNAGLNHYSINPQGILKFCGLSREASADLKAMPFKRGLAGLAKLLKQKYRSKSKCIACKIRRFCYQCPARAFLEVSDRESPVDYYCRLAESRKDNYTLSGLQNPS